MEFSPIPCHESLRPFIRNYWQLTCKCVSRGTQTVFSNGAASLHFYLSQRVSLKLDGYPDDDNGGKFFPTVLYHQNMKSIGIIVDEGDFNILGVEFVPFCSRLFFPERSVHNEKDLSEYITPEDMNDAEFVKFSNIIHSTESKDEQVRLLDEFFLSRLSKLPADDINMERLSDVFDDMIDVSHPLQASDDKKPSDLASTACLSQKQFTRVFNKYVGMNPKAYLRLLRFHKALMELQKSASDSSLTDIAWRCGYYDLAHMTTDFRDICGYSPSELLGCGSELTEAFGQQFSGLMKKKIKIENLI